MCARTPGDESAAPSKYSQYISGSRLNKAPLITMNSFADENCSNISVSLVELHTDLGAAASLLAGEGWAPPREAGPDPSLYSKYYDPATVNRAPFVTVSGSAKKYKMCAISVAMLDVPLRVNLPQAILDQNLGGSEYISIMEGLPIAPEIQLIDKKDSDAKNVVNVSFPVQPLNLVGAQVILNKYRK